MHRIHITRSSARAWSRQFGFFVELDKLLVSRHKHLLGSCHTAAVSAGSISNLRDWFCGGICGLRGGLLGGIGKWKSETRKSKIERNSKLETRKSELGSRERVCGRGVS